MTDPIVQCPGCEEYRHRTWFKAGERYCRECQETNPEWLDSLARAVVRAEKMERQRQEAIKNEIQIIMAGTKPPGFTNKEWRVVHRIDRGEDIDPVSYQAIIGKLIRLAESRIPQPQAATDRSPLTTRYTPSDRSADLILPAYLPILGIDVPE
jgi:uncharacterized protein (UPF0335 family)